MERVQSRGVLILATLYIHKYERKKEQNIIVQHLNSLDVKGSTSQDDVLGRQQNNTSLRLLSTKWEPFLISDSFYSSQHYLSVIFFIENIFVI